jgi:hypothetical protein
MDRIQRMGKFTAILYIAAIVEIFAAVNPWMTETGICNFRDQWSPSGLCDVPASFGSRMKWGTFGAVLWFWARHRERNSRQS